MIVNNTLVYLFQGRTLVIKSDILRVVEIQRETLRNRQAGLGRTALDGLPQLHSHALIISGVRRCGKSTLQFQMLRKKYKKAFYLNFEDPRLYEFEKTDLLRLDEIILESKSKVLFFDEIQIVDEWERYIRQKLDEGFKVVVTGSNASLLSGELGTKLTGRHISKELFPFSFLEFCEYKKKKPSETAVVNYMKIGGFPEYVKRGDDDILKYLLDDILVRDIAVRYGVRDVRSLKRLALYLVSNVGNLVTANKLKTQFDITATSTLTAYLSHLEYAYLMFFVPKFSYSIKKQIGNPRKVYSIDTGLVNVNTISFSEDKGRKFENLIFLHLRRKYADIFYFFEKGECDFVVFEKEAIHEVVQACYDLTRDNLKRELNGLYEALDFFDLKEGTIVTLNQTDRFEENGKVANVVPAHEFLMKK